MKRNSTSSYAVAFYAALIAAAVAGVGFFGVDKRGVVLAFCRAAL